MQVNKYEEYTGNHPGLEGIQAICLGRVGSDGIENIDQDKEQCDQQSHPALEVEVSDDLLSILHYRVFTRH